MASSTRIGILYLILIALVISECKNHEKMRKRPSPSKADTNPCTKITQSHPDEALLFAAKAESKRKPIASKRAEKETLIQLVQFFQSEFIDGEQSDLFWGANRLANQNNSSREMLAKNETFRKDWAEVSYEMIGSLHNRNAFTHDQKIIEDSTGYVAYDLLVVSDDWIRNHWKESLAATDSSFYKDVAESNYYQEVMEMDIRKGAPCESF